MSRQLGFDCVYAGAIAALLFSSRGCNKPAESSLTAAATPVSTSSRKPGNASDLPANDEILRQIDDALEYTYDHRRLSVGSTSNDQAAWQIVHGALAFKRE